MKLRHVGLVVDDIALMSDFYCDLLGGHVFSDQHENKVVIAALGLSTSCEIRTQKIAFGEGSVIELLHFSEPRDTTTNKGVYANGFSHIALTVSNILSIYKKYKDRFFCKLLITDSVLLAFMHDPEGNYLEIVQDL